MRASSTVLDVAKAQEANMLNIQVVVRSCDDACLWGALFSRLLVDSWAFLEASWAVLELVVEKEEEEGEKAYAA